MSLAADHAKMGLKIIMECAKPSQTRTPSKTFSPSLFV